MLDLNLPKYDFKVKTEDGSTQIFDVIRKQFVKLTPEEWVRQNFIQYLIDEKKYPASLMVVEYALKYNNMQKRADILCFNKEGAPQLMVECKAASAPINQKVFDQIARYNFSLKVPYLVVTNGLEHYCCAMDYEQNTYRFVEEIPLFV
jgi:hypothetical protein